MCTAATSKATKHPSWTESSHLYVQRITACGFGWWSNSEMSYIMICILALMGFLVECQHFYKQASCTVKHVTHPSLICAKSWSWFWFLHKDHPPVLKGTISRSCRQGCFTFPFWRSGCNPIGWEMGNSRNFPRTCDNCVSSVFEILWARSKSEKKRKYI